MLKAESEWDAESWTCALICATVVLRTLPRDSQNGATLPISFTEPTYLVHFYRFLKEREESDLLLFWLTFHLMLRLSFDLPFDAHA